MRTFLKQYGMCMFVLVLMSILIAFASPLGTIIKNTVNTQIKNVKEIEEDAIANTQTYTIVFDGIC